MKHFLWKTGVLVKKDFLDELSYRLSFFMEAGSIVFYSCTFYFVAKIFDAGSSPYLEKYNGDYFSFVLIGLAVANFMNISINTFSELMRSEQSIGTLETLVASPTPIYHIFLARLIWNFVHGSMQIFLYFLVGISFLSAKYTYESIAVVPIVLILSLLAFNAIGMMSAAFLLAYKRGNPLNIFLGFATAFLGGVYFPVDVFPPILKSISSVIPLTYTARLLRDACIRGAGWAELSSDMLVLAIMCMILVPIGFILFSLAMKKAKRDGTLSHY